MDAWLQIMADVKASINAVRESLADGKLTTKEVVTISRDCLNVMQDILGLVDSMLTAQKP
jgi:hypothetical protein